MRLLLHAFFFLCCSLAGVGMSYGQTANFTITPASGSGCAPLIVLFNATSSTGATSYYWSISGIPTTNATPSTTFSAAGTYPVTLHINSPNGPSFTRTITVYPGPTVSFSASPTSGCPPLAVAFTSSVTANSPGSLSYTWNYGDGITVANASANPTHTYTTSNTYPVTLSVTNGAGCTTTLPISNLITVYPKPSAAFTAPQTTYCSLPANVNFINSSSPGTAFSWTFGNSTTAGGSNPTATYNAAGAYTVTLSAVNSYGCTDQVIKTGYITVLANNATFSGPTSACDSSQAFFHNTTSGVTGSTLWWFGDGATDTGMYVNHVYTSVNTYFVKMVTRVGSCWDTVIRSIVINPKPVVSMSHDLPCMPGSWTFTATSSIPIATYNWAWASGGTATGNPVTHYYAQEGIDTTYLIVSTGAGCSDTIRIDTTYIQTYNPRVTYPKGGCYPFQATYFCDSIPCMNIPCVPHLLPACACSYPYKIISFMWWLDGVFVTTNQSFSTTFTTPGSHVVVLKTVTANNCTRYDTFFTCAGYKAHPTFYAYPDTVVCVQTPVWFKNTTGDSVTISYSWVYGTQPFEADTNTGDYNGYHKYRYPGVDTVILVAKICGCADTVQHYVTVHPADAHFIDSIYCPPSKTVAFKNTSTGATTDYWDFGDGATSTLANPPPHTYLNYGKYAVRHMTWNSTYGCRDTITDSVTLVPGSIGFTGDTTLCLGDTIRLLGSFTGLPVWHPNDAPPRAHGYNWGVNNVGLNDTSKTFLQFVPLTRGYYTISWVVLSGDKAQCIDSVHKTNYVLVSHPIANFGAVPRLGCTPLPVLFIDSTSYTPGTQPTQRDWLYGDGGSGSNNNPTISHTYTVAGKYAIKLKVTDWLGCTDSVTKIDYVEARHPTALFTPSTFSACVGQTVYFANTSTGATGLFYRWFFGDGDTSSIVTGIHIYKAVGAYTVRLIVTDSSGCSDTLTMPSIINITRPISAFTISDTIAVCPPLIVNFTSTATNATVYNWTLGNGSSSILANPSTTYINPGIYDVRLVVMDSNLCADTAYSHVRVLGYAGALSYSPLNGCAPLIVNFTANLSNVPRVVWDFSDGDTALAVGATFSHTYLNGGVYVPKLIFYDGKGCSASSLGIDTIKVDDVFAGFKVMPPCERTAIMLVDSSRSLFSPLVSWHWDFGGGQIATGPSVPRVYPSPGQYPATLIVTNARGCVDTITRNFTIYALPIITGSPDTAVCVPDAIPLSATGGVSYTWSPGATLSCTSCLSPLASPNVPTSYVVVGTDTNGCSNKDTIKIGIQTKATFSITKNGEICLGQTYQLFGTGATLYHWTPAESLNNADSSAPIATPLVTTTYIATGREGSCAADTHMVKVVVNPLPIIDAGHDERVVAGNAVQLQASGSGISRVEWKADPALSCTTCYAPYASPKATTVFYITAYTTKNCTATDSVTVRVLCDHSQLYIPNTFTPNGDGINDYFFPRGKGIDILTSFRVYSRWGELLFERPNMVVNDEYSGWNGTYNGQKLNPDVYVYIIEATCDNGDQIKWKGDVTLIR